MKLWWLVLVLLCTSVATAADTLELNDAGVPLDLRASQAKFTVQHLLIDHVSGTVPIVSAIIHVGADGLTPVSVEATLDPAHINSGDDDRDGSITGADWFDVKKFPLWTFKSNAVVTNPDGTYAITGTLTIHGVGVPVTLATTVLRKAGHPAYHATTNVDRHAFGMIVTRTDALVGNDVGIVLDMQTK
jgi:polyisoprenoid-binding protein YceI